MLQHSSPRQLTPQHWAQIFLHGQNQRFFKSQFDRFILSRSFPIEIGGCIPVARQPTYWNSTIVLNLFSRDLASDIPGWLGGIYFLVFQARAPSRSFDKINSRFSVAKQPLTKLRLELQLTHSIPSGSRKGWKSNEVSSQELGSEPAGSEGAKFRLWVKSKGLQLAPPDSQDVAGKDAERVGKIIEPEQADETALYLPTGTDKVKLRIDNIWLSCFFAHALPLYSVTQSVISDASKFMFVCVLGSFLLGHAVHCSQLDQRWASHCSHPQLYLHRRCKHNFSTAIMHFALFFRELALICWLSVFLMGVIWSF